ncbi:MAG: DUF4846 domain-containing protein [Lewinella sp.]|nr:DUF4846 domain-containing protein [Lewinella sp.]
MTMQVSSGEPIEQIEPDTPLVNPAGQTIDTRFNPPRGFRREVYSDDSFGYYLQHFPLQEDGASVMLFDGREKARQDVHAAVLDLDIGDRDLQQCADAVMRLRAEYLWQQKRYEEIHFNFNNGFRADYQRWRRGERIRISGNEVSWVQRAGISETYADFRRYLVMVFAYAGTLSLSQELEPRDLSDIEVGDVFIQGGNPGHAVIVMDKARRDDNGEKLILLAQSYMPAQSIHVLRNPANLLLSPWYAVKDFREYILTPEWRFKTADLKRF